MAPVRAGVRRRAGTLCAVLALLTACTASSGEPGPVETPAVTGTTPLSPSGAPTVAASGTPHPIPAEVLAGVTAEIRQSRSDWAARVVAVRVRNATPDALTVTAAELTTPTADGTAHSEAGWSRLVPTDAYRDALVPLGAPRCGDLPAGAPTVRVSLADDEGRTAQIQLTPGDPQGHLTRIRGEDCAEAAVSAGVTLRFDELTVADRDGLLVATLWLAATPVEDGPPVTLTSLDGTVLAAPLGGGRWPLAALGDPVTTAGRVGLDLLPGRCDAHAVAEDKRGSFLGVHAAVAGVAQPVFYVGTGEDVRGALHDYIARYCGWGSAGATED